MNGKFNSLEVDLENLLDNLGELFTAVEMETVRGFINAGEYGLSFETICGMISENNRKLPDHLHHIFRGLAHRMKIDHSFWSNITDIDPKGT